MTVDNPARPRLLTPFVRSWVAIRAESPHWNLPQKPRSRVFLDAMFSVRYGAQLTKEPWR